MTIRIAAYELAAGSTGLEGLRRTERLKPVPASHEVLVCMRAASLNYRDLAIATNRYFNAPIARDVIPLSDGTGEVEAVGTKVSRFKPGDRVVALFKQHGRSLGLPLDGTLTEYAVFSEDGLLPMPENLTFEEAATLPVAGVTAWNALCEGRSIRPGDTVLTLGTGGVSMFVLQLAKAIGARVIVTSSSDHKLERVKRCGADAVINHARYPDWAAIVLELTSRAGVDQIVELFGPQTLPQSCQAVREGGEIAIVAEPTRVTDIMRECPVGKSVSLRTITCDDSNHFRKLNAAISENRISPMIDSVYPFDRAIDAYQEALAHRHVGKIVISIRD